MAHKHEAPKGRPTRIVSKPWREKVGKYNCLMFACNDGQTYNQQELAALPHINVLASTLSLRLAKLGWGHPDMLKPGKHKRRQRADKKPEKPTLQPPKILISEGPYRYCPVTGNIPMVCSHEGFSRSCATLSVLKEFAATTRKYPYCAICKGELLPDGLTLVDASVLGLNRQTAREI